MRNGAALHPARPCASLDLGDSQLSVDALGNELDLCADLELFQHRVISDLEYHRHGRHLEVLQLFMDERDLLRLLVQLLDRAAGEFLREGGGAEGEGDGAGAGAGEYDVVWQLTARICLNIFN